MHLVIKFSAIILSLSFLTACGVDNNVDTCQNLHPSQQEKCGALDPVWNKMDWDKASWG